MINRTKVKESTQIKPGDNGDVLVMKDNAPEWSTPSDADLAKVSDTDAKLAEKQDKLTAGDNIKIEDNVISAAPKPTPINIGTVTEGDTAMVSNSGTDTDVVLNFVLPRGEKGEPGKDGTQVNNISPLIVSTAPYANRPDYNLAIGNGAQASTGLSQLSVGPKAICSGVRSPDGFNSVGCSIAVGGGAAATGAFTAAVGYNAKANSNGSNIEGSSAFGCGAITFPDTRGGTAVGANAIVSKDFGTAIGLGASVANDYGVAIGRDSHTTRDYEVSVGKASGVSRPDTPFTRLVSNVTDPEEPQDAATKNYVDTEIAKVPTVNSIAPLTVETSPVVDRGSIALGNDIQAPRNDANSIIVGNNIHLTNVDRNNVIIGELGDRTKSFMDGAVVVGMDNDVSKMNYGGSALAPTTIIGARNTFLEGWGNGDNDPANHVGDIPVVARLTSICGAGNTIHGSYSVVVGNNSTAELERSVIVGYSSEITDTMSPGSRYTHGGGVAIGSYCRADNYSVAIGPNYATDKTITFDKEDLPSGYYGSNFGVAIGSRAHSLSNYGLAIGASSSVASAAGYAAAIGAMSSATEPYTVSVGSGDATMALTDDMDEETKARIQARAAAATRRVVNVTDPTGAQDAATKNYVDTQLEPINAKLQYVPENTNQILSQIETNAEKAQAAATAAQSTADGAKADLTALQTTVAQLQQTVTQLQATINNLTLETERI